MVIRLRLEEAPAQKVLPSLLYTEVGVSCATPPLFCANQIGFTSDSISEIICGDDSPGL